MASRREQNMKYRRYSGRVNGNLAYDPAYEERQRRLRREQEYEREHQREEFMRPPQRKVQKKAAPVRRQREKVSLGALCGFAALAAMVALMILCRAQLTEISSQVVSVQKEIAALEDEHVALLTRYEKTFDLTTIKEAAAAAVWPSPAPRRSTISTCRKLTAWSSISRRARTCWLGRSHRLATAYVRWWNISNERSYT